MRYPIEYYRPLGIQGGPGYGGIANPKATLLVNLLDDPLHRTGPHI